MNKLSDSNTSAPRPGRGELMQRTALVAGTAMMDAMARTRVIVIGVGGVGSWCVEGLVRSGIGHITIVDADIVAPSNVNRQLPALVSTIGRPKVDVLAERMLDINPVLDIRPVQALYEPATASGFGLEDYDYIIDAIDMLEAKAHLIRHATSTGRHFFSSMGAALKLDPSRIAVAEFRKVKGCPLARALRQRFKRTSLYPARKFKCVYSDELLRNRIDDGSRANGTFATATAMFGLRLASLVVEHIYSTTADKNAGKIV